MAARDIMDTIGLGQKYSNEIIGKVFNIGNNLGLPPKALRNTLEGLEEEIEEETGVAVNCRSTKRAPTFSWSRRARTFSLRRIWKA